MYIVDDPVVMVKFAYTAVYSHSFMHRWVFSTHQFHSVHIRFLFFFLTLSFSFRIFLHCQSHAISDTYENHTNAFDNQQHIFNGNYLMWNSVDIGRFSENFGYLWFLIDFENAERYSISFITSFAFIYNVFSWLLP